ncbi:metallophosphoesterase [Mucilaginibacter myungsuensis]|uniref:Metallophosphoesterase n=1 Tax=Mucilaginibacter myungsuensis TaxID=649104 RepID=A0A929KUF3_9SPHI|nr:metallophosphoesterase [Mucilaginibacter myungsuensis]MBE9661764.1 metallophosphoesterase [Mucilaginibacter myungsuensis]MDN3599802.1 metallophosphoesterase [Mucilaginibacter myungsuensis]
MRGGGIFKLFLIFSVVTFLMDWYVYHGLKTWTLDWQNKRAQQILLWCYLIVSIGVTVVFLGGLFFLSTAKGLSHFHEYMLSLFLTFFVSKLIFIIVMFLGDIGRFFAGVVKYLSSNPKNGEPFFPSRRKFISELAILIAAIPFSSFFYAMWKGKYHYKVHRQTIYFDDLPEAFDGFTITQLSDIHAGSFDNPEAVQRGINLAQAQKSDLFVFTGDLVNNAAFEIEPYIERFRQLKSPFGQFSVLGNHDYGDYIKWDSEAEKHANLEQLKVNHWAMSYKLLLDEHVELEKDGQKISLIGVQNWGDHFVQKGDLNKALTGVDPNAFKILLSHDPTHWEKVVKDHPSNIHLTLAGHTHGAQFGIEAAALRWSPVQYRYKHWSGLAEHAGRYLYINRGFGFLAFSGRLGIWPEITVLTLKRKR